jgi:hypothetical protein
MRIQTGQKDKDFSLAVKKRSWVLNPDALTLEPRQSLVPSTSGIPVMGLALSNFLKFPF